MYPKFPKKVHIKPNKNRQTNILSGFKKPNMLLSFNDIYSAPSNVMDRTMKNIVIKMF